MDRDRDVLEMQPGVGESYPFHSLTRIPLDESYKERAEWLWNHLKTQDYAFDDFSRGNSQLFVQALFQPNSEHFEFGDQGYTCARNIVPKLSADVHFATWGEPKVGDVIEAGRELIRYLFQAHDLRRINAFVPDYNRHARRFATLLGFRYEGQMRQAILSHNKYHNVGIYGLLREEFEKREVHN